MKVLVLGTTGFIGFPAAQALVRAGHIVYGLARTAEKAKVLAAEEIIPILGDINSDIWLSLIASLDAIIECLGGPETATLGKATFERVVQAAKELRPVDATPMSYIYTSGTLVHGDSRTETVTDTTPIVRPAALVAWRPAVEQQVLRSTAVNGIVVRPSVLYGRSASGLALLFQAAIAAQGKLKWPGAPGGKYSVIHVDDLADLYVRMAEKGSLIAGKIFDAANPTHVSVDELLQKVVDASGSQGTFEYTNPTNVFEQAATSTTLVRPYLANALLGWTPKKAGLIEGFDVYYAAWQASKSE